jgi:hypothetical protein
MRLEPQIHPANGNQGQLVRFQLKPILLIVLAFIACGHVESPSGPEEHESRSIDLDKSERVRAEIKMPVGELDVRGGAQKLLDADFTYNVPSWKPDLRYHSSGIAGDLIVEQHGPTSASGNAKNRWELRFNDKVPVDLRVEFGAGEARLNVGSLSLRSINLAMGAGRLRIDLRGRPTKDYSVRVRGGVGEATIYLPKDAGISATAKGGIGEISVSGLRNDGERYVSDAYDRVSVRIRVDVQGGVGSIKLIAE